MRAIAGMRFGGEDELRCGPAGRDNLMGILFQACVTAAYSSRDGFFVNEKILPGAFVSGRELF